MDTKRVEYKGFELKRGQICLVLYTGLRSFGPSEEATIAHLEPEMIRAIELLDKNKGKLVLFELSKARQKWAKFGDALRQTGNRSFGIGSATATITGILGFFFPPAWTLTGYSLLTSMGGMASYIIGDTTEGAARNVRYVKFSCEVKSKTNLARRYDYLADVIFSARMPEKHYRAVVKRLEELQRGEVLTPEIVLEIERMVATL